MALNFQGIKSVIDRPNLGLLFIRLVIAAILLRAGVGKFSGGESVLHAVGESVKYVGLAVGSNNAITLFLGILAAGSQVVGSALLALGLFPRTAAFVLVGTMTVATVSKYHSAAGNLNEVGYPLLVAVVLLGLLFTGPGRMAIHRD